MSNQIVIREAIASDLTYILSLSPSLAEVADLAWHSDDVVQKMQDEYIVDTLNQKKELSTTFIAEENSKPLGFIHVCSHKDEISNENCGTVPLLAVSPNAQGKGVGKLLMSKAENWAKAQGFRLLHLEVFANNSNARSFYEKLSFKPETLHMIKTLK